jgi:hypothetical protein
VTRDPSRSRAGDRGQLVLVGAVAVAFLILALVPVYNAVFTADSVGADGSGTVEDRSVAVESQLQVAARQIAVRVAHEKTYDTESKLADAYQQAFRNYSHAAGESAIRSSDTYVNASFNASSPGTIYGVRVVQEDLEAVTNPPDSRSDWHVVGPGQPTTLGWFVVKLDAANLSDSSAFVVHLDNGSDTASIAMRREQLTNDVQVIVSRNGSTVQQVVCESERDQLVLDLYRGRSSGRSCTFPGLNELRGPVTVEVENGSSAVAAYELVVKEAIRVHGSVRRCGHGPAWKSPCRSHAFWQVALSTQVAGSQTGYTRQSNVTVYGRES